MLCPECRRRCPGGSVCSRCGEPVPERETFAGQGGHYLRVLFGLSIVMLGVAGLVAAPRDLGSVAAELYVTGWLWVVALVLLLPNVIGLYYWFMLHEEEIVVTDEQIERRSRWGDEQIRWDEVTGYYQRSILFRQTRLGRIAWLSRVFRKRSTILEPANLTYELVGSLDGMGGRRRLRLDPGTIGDMAWLLALIEEHVGPPTME